MLRPALNSYVSRVSKLESVQKEIKNVGNYLAKLDAKILLLNRDKADSWISVLWGGLLFSVGMLVEAYRHMQITLAENKVRDEQVAEIGSGLNATRFTMVDGLRNTANTASLHLIYENAGLGAGALLLFGLLLLNNHRVLQKNALENLSDWSFNQLAPEISGPGKYLFKRLHLQYNPKITVGEVRSALLAKCEDLSRVEKNLTLVFAPCKTMRKQKRMRKPSLPVIYEQDGLEFTPPPLSIRRRISALKQSYSLFKAKDMEQPNVLLPSAPSLLKSSQLRVS